jgi:hypothetical protein
VTESVVDVDVVPAGFWTPHVIVNVPGLPAVRDAEIVIEFVPAPAVMLGDVPVPPNVHVKLPAWVGTLAVKLAPAVTLLDDTETVELGGG